MFQLLLIQSCHWIGGILDCVEVNGDFLGDKYQYKVSLKEATASDSPFDSVFPSLEFSLSSGTGPVERLVDYLKVNLGRKGLYAILSYDRKEVESFIRAQNHIPILEKSQLSEIDSFFYLFKIGLEDLLGDRVTMAFQGALQQGKEQSFYRFFQSIEVELNKFLNQFKLSLVLLDVEMTNIYYRLELDKHFYQDLEEAKEFQLKALFKEIFQKGTYKIPQFNSLEWLDKPWK